MKKKGFTLVELLAVIAILAILVIIALPNVMSLFNEAKQNSFKNEVREILKTAQEQWMTDSLNVTGDSGKAYARVDATKSDNVTSACVKGGELKLSGRTGLRYAIVINSSGEVTDFVATDDTFVYDSNGASTPIKVEDITSVTVISDTANATGAKIEFDGTTGVKVTITTAS